MKPVKKQQLSAGKRGLDWFKCYPSTQLDMLQGLSSREMAVYSVIQNLIYQRGGPISCDAKWIAGWIADMGAAAVRTAVAGLQEAGLIAVGDGSIFIETAEIQIESVEKLRKSASDRGKKGGENSAVSRSKSSAHNKTDQAVASNFHEADKEKSKSKKEETSSLSSENGFPTLDAPKVDRNDEILTEALSVYHASAERVGWPKVVKFTPKRKAALRQRLRDAGGLEGWAAAMTRAERSSFCTGAKTDFRADLDFFLQEQSFIRLVEGRYDDRPPSGLKVAANPEVAARVLSGPIVYRVKDWCCETQNVDGTWREVFRTPAELHERMTERGCEFDWTECSPARAAELKAELAAVQGEAA